MPPKDESENPNTVSDKASDVAEDIVPDAVESEKNKQIDAWAKKVMFDKVSIDSLPASQQWMRSAIEQRMAEVIQGQPFAEEKVSQLVSKKLAEERQAQELAEAKEAIASLPPAQKAEYDEIIKDFANLPELEQAKLGLKVIKKTASHMPANFNHNTDKDLDKVIGSVMDFMKQ
jgi:predicted transcriptional regulator